jgi:hypothetical protein
MEIEDVVRKHLGAESWTLEVDERGGFRANCGVDTCLKYSTLCCAQRTLEWLHKPDFEVNQSY